MENNKEKMELKQWLKNKGNQLKEKATDAADVLKDTGIKAGEKAIQLAGEAVDVAKDAGEQAGCALNKAKLEMDRKRFHPVFEEDLNSDTFDKPKIVYLVEKDLHADNEACKNAIGYMPIVSNCKIYEVTKRGANLSKIELYPNTEGSIYIRNPYMPERYVNLEDYFDNIKKERVNGLVTVANKLGAKYVKISIKEEKRSFVSATAKKGIIVKNKGGKDQAGITDEINFSMRNLNTVEIAHEQIFEGNSIPERPTLVYYKNDSDIESFIEMCFSNNKPKEKTYMLKYNRSSDISAKFAESIDGVLSKLQLGGSVSVKSEIERQNRLYYEYHIEF